MDDIFGTPSKHRMPKQPQQDDGGVDIFGTPSAHMTKQTQPAPQTPAQAPQAPEQSAPQPEQFSALDSLKNSFLGGAVRGLQDVGEGAAQLGVRTLEGLPRALGIERHPSIQPIQESLTRNRADLEQRMAQSERIYKKDWRQGEDVGLDPGRIAGNIAGTIPLGLAVPGAAATGALGRTAYGAGAGMLGAATMPVLNGDDFQKEKLQQLAIGGGAGAIGPHVANLVGKGASKVIGGVKRAFTPAVTRSQAVDTITEALRTKGVNFSRLAKETQDELLTQAQKSLNVSGDLNIDELARKADFDALNIKPTRGQLTYDPSQITFEKNTAKLEGAGDDLRNLFNQQNRQLIGGVNQVRPAGGVDPYQAGQQGIDVLKQVDTARQGAVSDLYTAARNEIGVDTPLNAERFMQTVDTKLDDIIASLDELPGGVKTKLAKIASGEIPFTIKKGEQIRQAINKRMGSASRAEQVSLKAINDSIQEEIDAVGMQAGEAFKTARGAASQRFEQIKASPAMQAVVKDVATADDFIKKHVINSKAGPLMSLRNDVQKADASVWAEMKGQVVDHLKSKALSGQADDVGKFSAAAYNKALNNIGNAKLKVLFSPQELRQLRAVGRVSSSIMNQPVGSAVNNSNTTAMIANLLNTSSKVPLLNLAADPLSKGLTGLRAGQAMRPQFTSPQQIPGLSPQAISSLNLPFSLAGYPLINRMQE